MTTSLKPRVTIPATAMTWGGVHGVGAGAATVEPLSAVTEGPGRSPAPPTGYGRRRAPNDAMGSDVRRHRELAEHGRPPPGEHVADHHGEPEGAAEVAVPLGPGEVALLGQHQLERPVGEVVQVAAVE